eukprot:g1109.t1
MIGKGLHQCLRYRNARFVSRSFVHIQQSFRPFCNKPGTGGFDTSGVNSESPTDGEADSDLERAAELLVEVEQLSTTNFDVASPELQRMINDLEGVAEAARGNISTDAANKFERLDIIPAALQESSNEDEKQGETQGGKNASSSQSRRKLIKFLKSKGRTKEKEIKLDQIHMFNTSLLHGIVSPRGRIMGRRATQLPTKVQRKMTKAIKRSRNLGFMSPVGKNTPYGMLTVYARGQRKRRKEEDS